MGDKSEWDLIGDALSHGLPEEWNIISIDLPGHGDSSVVLSSDQQVAHSSLGLDAMRPFGPPENSPFSLDMMARAVCHSLIHDHGVEQLDAIVGYSLGGRIALAMKRLYSMSLPSQNRDLGDPPASFFLTDQTKLICCHQALESYLTAPFMEVLMTCSVYQRTTQLQSPCSRRPTDPT
jgi:hypothetical protein